MAKATLEGKALHVIPDYMILQNRPYSAIDVWNNLHQEFGKTLVTKALCEGVTQGLLKEKLIGKQKIYYADQDKLEKFDDSVLVEYDKKIALLNEQQVTLNATWKKLSSDLLKAHSSKTTPELIKELKQLKKKVSEMEIRCSKLESSRGSEIESEGKKLREAEEKAHKESRKRKRIAMDMFSSIYENVEINKKQLIDNIGLEMDS